MLPRSECCCYASCDILCKGCQRVFIFGSFFFSLCNKVIHVLFSVTLHCNVITFKTNATQLCDETWLNKQTIKRKKKQNGICHKPRHDSVARSATVTPTPHWSQSLFTAWLSLCVLMPFSLWDAEHRRSPSFSWAWSKKKCLNPVFYYLITPYRLSVKLFICTAANYNIHSAACVLKKKKMNRGSL